MPPAQLRIAWTELSTTASNTARRSNAERLMTSSTFDVAVCCSSDSVSSRVRCCSASNRRVFSIAMTALVSEGFDKLNLLFGKRINLLASQCDNTDGYTLPHERDAEQSSKTTKSSPSGR